MRQYLAQIIRHRKLVVFFTMLVTLGLLAQLRSLTVIIDPDNTLPQTHPFIATGNVIEKVFGNKFTVVVGITPKTGDVFQQNVLEKVKNITNRIAASPLAVKGNISSLSSRKSKNILGNEEGMIVRPLMEKVPATEAEMAELRKGVDSNPVYRDLLVSKRSPHDTIVAEFKKADGGFAEIARVVREAVAPDKDDSVDIEVSGLTIFSLGKVLGANGLLVP
jgi:predicted RND superfamily exporter protein